MSRSPYSLGTDLVRVEDVRDSIARFGDRYLERVFTPGERAHCQAAGDAAPALAARFAAKEAVLKALEVGNEAVPWLSIEVVRRRSGAPAVLLHGPARRMARRRRLAGFSLSIAHEADYATAVVIAGRTLRERSTRRHTGRA